MQVIDDTQAHIDRIEQRMRLLHVSNRVMSWDGHDDLSVTALPIKLHIPDIEKNTGIGLPPYPLAVVQHCYA